MIGFETIGNATITIFDKEPIITTDPWILGNPYFGSWCHKYQIPDTQYKNILKAKYVFLSHGHPDHIDPDSLDLFKDKTFILASHYGKRIYNELSKNFKCIELKNNQWFSVSDNIRVKVFADWNQDSTAIFEVLKENVILNLNDGNALGWSKEIKKIIKNYKNRFLLKLVNWGDADMINFYDTDGKFIEPQASQMPPCGITYAYHMKRWNCNYAIPFSSLHTYVRKDSIQMNKYVTPLDAHSEKFNDKQGNLLPAFIIWDFQKNDYKLINPPQNFNEPKDPQVFGDNWSDELDKEDKKQINLYFSKFDHVKEKFGFINFRIGNKDFNLKLSDKNEGLKFETPRNSLMYSINNNIFDDILIGNFAKVQLINVNSLYPDFNPFIAKYGDNGGARSKTEINDYFNYYKLNSANYWNDFLRFKTAEIIRGKLEKYKTFYKFLKNLQKRF